MNKSYLLEKLSDINLRMATHEGDANQRLASEAQKIILLPQNKIPTQYKNEFENLLGLAKTTVKKLPSPLMLPSKIRGIQNKTAVKYIKLLIDIEKELEFEE